MRIKKKLKVDDNFLLVSLLRFFCSIPSHTFCIDSIDYRSKHVTKINPKTTTFFLEGVIECSTLSHSGERQIFTYD